MDRNSPIVVFDSGVGGVAEVEEVFLRQLPHQGPQDADPALRPNTISRPP